LSGTSIKNFYKKILIKNNILLLQGPVGYFFKEFANFCEKNKTNVFKINFHLGEQYFFKTKLTHMYSGNLKNWPEFLDKYINDNKIQQIFIVGPHRPYHTPLNNIVEKYNIELVVFEEGYLRPDFITVEIGNVNRYSSIPKNLDFYQKYKQRYKSIPKAIYKSGNLIRFLQKTILFYKYVWGLYLSKYILCSPYQHHTHENTNRLTSRVLWFTEIYRGHKIGINLFILKPFYKISALYNNRWLDQNKFQYYLVPLQLATDSAILVHSETYKNISDFITDVIRSFAKNAPNNTILLIKHHPMDFRIHNYKKLIRKLATELCVFERVKYIHEAYQPKCLANTLGCITINSTMGLSAVSQGVPTITLSKHAIYNINGLTNQCSLDDFWSKLEKPNLNLCSKFLDYVVYNTQMPGNFYGGVINDFENKFIFENHT
jgi:capsular polysaccharide export protein